MSSPANKNLLILSYYWPPLGGPGAIRPVKFAKYLPGFGYEPVVITRKEIAYHSYDELLIKEVEKTKVLRTETLDPARLLWLVGMRKYRPRPWQRPLKQAFNFPDHKILWLPFAGRAGIKQDHDFVMATAPPFSAFVTGYMISRRSGKPLILDFRDAWVEFPFLPYRGVQRKIAAYLEKKVADHASLIIVVDDNLRDILIKKYPWVGKKLNVIPNGYDPDDFVVSEYPEQFTLSYLGTVRRERDPENVLRAVNQLISEKKIGSSDIRVKFIGHIEDPYRTRIGHYPFAKIHDHKPYVAALREFASAHVAIMVTTGGELFFPSRQNEYLATGLPIIVCGRSKGIHLLTDAFKRGYPGWTYDFSDINGIKQGIFELFNAWQNKRLMRGQRPYPELTREKLAQRLAHLIDTL